MIECKESEETRENTQEEYDYTNEERFEEEECLEDEEPDYCD